jgi:hypothetical protein
MVEPERRSKWITHRWPTDLDHSERIRALQETAVLPFYKRYVAGEFRDVWRELAALGDTVWLDPVAADALAVCYETMHRAKTNIEILVGALDAAEYEFRPTVWSPYWRRTQASKEWIESRDEEAQSFLAVAQEPPTNRPGPLRELINADREQLLTNFRKTASSFHEERLGIVRPLVQANPPSWIGKLTSRAGDLPLSLRVWHSTVGGVNLVGRHPELAPPGVECDPLFVAPLRGVVDVCTAWQEDHAGEKERPPFQMPISPPASVKAGNSADGAQYVVTLPSPTLDAVVENEPHGLCFVDYLRLAFEWEVFRVTRICPAVCQHWSIGSKRSCCLSDRREGRGDGFPSTAQPRSGFGGGSRSGGGDRRRYRLLLTRKR